MILLTLGVLNPAAGVKVAVVAAAPLDRDAAVLLRVVKVG